MEKDCKRIFAQEVKKLLEGSKTDLNKFLAYWEAEEYRHAYLFMYELIEAKKLQLSDSYKKASEEFYWLYIA